MKKKVIGAIIAFIVIIGGGLWYFQNQPKGADVEGLLKEIFTMPNQQVSGYYDEIEKGQLPSKDIEKIIDDEFGKYFNEKGLESFVTKYCLTNYIASLSNDIKQNVEAKDIKVSYDKDDFTYQLALVVKDKDYLISGSGKTNNGKVEYFNFDDQAIKTIEEIRQSN